MEVCRNPVKREEAVKLAWRGQSLGDSLIEDIEETEEEKCSTLECGKEGKNNS